MPRSHGLGKPLALHRAMNHSEHGPRPCHKQSDSSSGVAIKPSSFPASAAAACRLQALRWQSQRRSRCVTDSDPTCVPASESTASGMGSIVSRSEACQALFAAAKANDTDEVARQLAAGALANWRASGKARLTPLHWAARHGNAELVRLLLAHGAVLEAKSASELTALGCAASSGNVEVVRLLLDSGADLEARDEDEFSPFLFAAASGHPEVLRLLLERGADAKARSVGGLTALHLACRYGGVEAVRVLLDSGADFEARDDQNWTPLHEAGEYGKVESIRALLGAGADPLASDNFRRTAVDACTDDVCRDLMANPESAQRWLRRQQLVIWQASN